MERKRSSIWDWSLGMPSSARTSFGISSRRFVISWEAELRKAKDIALDEMREQARNLGTNAIVGIDIDYETIGASSSMLMVSATGTAVVVEPP